MSDFPKSALQTQYPLSPRKFWKKIIERVFVFIYLPPLLLVPVFLFVFGASVKINGHIITNSQRVWLVIFLWSVIFLVVIFLYAWYVHAYIKRYYYDASPDFVTIKKGVFTPTEIHVQYGKIQDVYVDQDLIDRILGIYDVHIASATVASGIEAHIDGVDYRAAEGLKTYLLSKISGQVATSVPTNSPVRPIGPLTFNTGEEISSATYPISPRWLLARTLSGFCWTVFAFVFFSLIGLGSALSKGKDVPFVPNRLTMLFLFLLFLLIWRLVYLAIWKKNFRFEFMTNFIRLYTSVVSKAEQQLPYSSIQDVMVRQRLFDRLFGICSVFITNAAARSFGIILPGQSLANGNKIAEILKEQVLSADRSKTGL